MQEYIDGTPQEVGGHVQLWIDKMLALAKPQPRILEIGSAFGRDALYLESQGCAVDRTDATEAFVERLRAEGHTAEVLNAITDNFPGEHDIVYANAVFLHFTDNELRQVLRKSYDYLAEGGILAFTVKQGDGADWSQEKLGAPRFFQFWRPEPLKTEVEAIGFTVKVLFPESEPDAKWLHVVAQK